jgi:glutamate---cysteine ligase / carboxylate-amine ligase
MAEEYTIGVEEEYQLVDATSGALRSRACDVLLTDWTAEMRPELQETTLEVGTRICASASELDRELRRLRFQAATTASAVGLQIVAAGIHPFSRWRGHKLSGGERYRQIASRYGRIARDEHNFGMHIHVAVPPGRDRVRIQNVVRHFGPHLTALAASSPFFEGTDTRYASYRMVLWRRWPGSGVPPRLESEDEYERLMGLMVSSGAMADKRNLYWSIRPHAIYPKLEFRGTDVCPRLYDAVAIATVARALVAAADQGLLREPSNGLATEMQSTLLGVNEWRAIRYGLDGWLVDPEAPMGRMPVRQAVLRLLDEIAPVAEALGDGGALEGIRSLLSRGNGAVRMRRVRRTCGGVRPVVQWLMAETLLGTGMDRRRAQREMPA